MFPERLPFLIITLCLAAAAPLAAQQQPPADTFPPSFEVVTRLRLHADSAAAAETAVTGTACTGAVRSQPGAATTAAPTKIQTRVRVRVRARVTSPPAAVPPYSRRRI
jgi:hypothetical protein